MQHTRQTLELRHKTWLISCAASWRQSHSRRRTFLLCRLSTERLSQSLVWPRLLQGVGDKCSVHCRFPYFNSKRCLLCLFCFASDSYKEESTTANFFWFPFIQSVIQGFNGDYLFNSLMITSCYVLPFRTIMTRLEYLNPFVAHINY